MLLLERGDRGAASRLVVEPERERPRFLRREPERRHVHRRLLVRRGRSRDVAGRRRLERRSVQLSGSLYNLSDGQTLFGGYVKPENLTVAGQMSVHFDDDTHGTFTWPGGV